MKVFMLEHGQAQGAPSASEEDREEVFRDDPVGELETALTWLALLFTTLRFPEPRH